MLCASATPLQAQVRRNGRDTKKYGVMTLREKPLPDSLELARRDSLHRADSLHKADSVTMLGKSSLTAPAFTAAHDSIVEVLSDGQRKIFYYGNVTVKYDDMELSSEYMEYDMNTGTVYARGVYDSTNAEWRGRPVMKQQGKTYNMEELYYNFDSRKARIKNMETTEMDGKLLGQKIKMMPDNSINVSGGRYTVCDAEHPHYYLHMTSAKVVTKPSQKTVFGPAWAVLEDVAFPLVLPFGFVPKRPERATGILFPTFGEEEARGFFFRDLGMYFVFGDHFDLSVTGDYYTLGSWAVNVNSRYKVNYKFNGSVSINYSYDQTGDKDIPGDFFTTTNFGVRWSHQQDSKAHPGVSFSASVNFSTPSNSRYNSHSVNEALQNQTSSSISFSRNWGGKFNLALSGSHSQNSRDSSYSISLPNVTFSMSTIYPFKRKNRVGKERFYEKFSIGYNTSFNNRINFKSSEFSLSDPKFLDKMENTMTHNFSIGLPSFTLFKYLTFSPSVSYGMDWYFRQYDARYNEEKKAVEQVRGGAFSSFGIMHRGSAGLSMSTRIYGTFNFGKYNTVQAIRHVISPSMSISYTPDLSKDWNGYRDYHYVDAEGNDQLYQYNVYTGSVGRPMGKSANASISFGNNLEAKVRDLADTTGTGSKKVKLIDQLNISTSYNFLADSLKMNVVSMNMSTNLFNKVNISASASFDPYAIDATGKKYNRYAVAAGQGLLRFNSVSASLSYSISGKGTFVGDDGRHSPVEDNGGSDVTQGAASYYKRMYYHPVTGEFIPGGWLYYTNPNVPWSLNLSASFSLVKNYVYDSEQKVLNSKDNINATLNLSGNIKITPRLSLNATSGFDFVSMKITTTQVSATYDLHCFNIAVQWVPLGMYKSYSFRIAANAAALSDLLRFRKSNSYWDN